MSHTNAKDATSSPRVVIVGAGISGIAMGIALKTRLKCDNFTIYEKDAIIGGTWRDNTYPGCGSDVGGHFYSLSTELNPYWENYFITQPEIQAYWEKIYWKHDLSAHTIFDTQVEVVRWDASAQVHKLTLRHAGTDERTESQAHIVIQAVGGFSAAYFPADLPGVQTFRGPLWHSLQWRHDVDLKGKSVGVIGNGCSAAQFIPIISKDPTVNVINFCRTPQWLVERKQYRYPEWVKWVFAHVPFAMRAYRSLIMLESDLVFLIFQKRYTPLLYLARKDMERYMKKTAPAKYHDQLISSYSPGCKRIVLDPDYLSSLHRPNVDLNWTGIERIVEQGIELKTGEVVPLDVIILGTGFLIVPTTLSVEGRDGLTLHEYFNSHGGPTGYRGTVYPGFPNLFTIVGPNTVGPTSLLWTSEIQIQYILQLIMPILQGKARSIEVTPDATDEYNAWIQKRMRNTVFTECSSYYRGDDRKGKNVASFPGPLNLFWWITRKPRWEDFAAVGADEWAQEKRRQGIIRWGVGLTLPLLLLLTWVLS